MFLLALATQLALAGYGDPIDGIPNPGERELHLWTNAVRVDPEAFIEFYECSFDSFSGSEQTPKMPLLWQDGLGEAARFHTDDMMESNNFSHTSSDGTPFGSRLARYYEGGMVGENIAMGYPDPWAAVVIGWMCSTGHRANIMADYEELGTGVVDTWYTQDFGSRGVDISDNAVRLGAHSPENPSPGATVEFLAAFYDGAGEDVARFEVIVNGVPHRMKHVYGTKSSGVFGTELEVVDDCTAYFFQAERFDGSLHNYPEEGVYGFGTCAWVDDEAMWMFRDEAGLGYGETGPIEEEDRGTPPHRKWRKWPFHGCNSANAPAGWIVFALLPLLIRRRP